MKTWLKVVLGIVACFFVIGIIATIFSPSETDYLTGDVINEEQASPKSKEKIKILDHNMEYGEFGTLMIVGTAENVAGRQLSYTEIRVKFYDKDGALIETFMDNINDLDAGEKWKFKVMYPGMDGYKVDSYEVRVGTVW